MDTNASWILCSVCIVFRAKEQIAGAGGVITYRKPLAGKVGSVASRRYVEQVERQREPGASHWHRLRQRDLYTMWCGWVVLVSMIPFGVLAFDRFLLDWIAGHAERFFIYSDKKKDDNKDE